MVEGEWWVPLAVAFATGTAFPKLIDVWNEWRRERKAARHQVDPMVLRLQEANARADRAEKRMRKAVEWGHETRVIALQAGVRSSELPKLDLGS